MKVEFENDKTKDKIEKVLCTSCENTTKHKVLTSINEKGTEPWGNYASFDWNTDYEIIQCLGCDTVSFRYYSINSENTDHEYRPIPTIRIYPKRGKDTLTTKHYFNVPYNLQRIYSETIDSYNNGNLTLCGAGVRALVEGLCQENGITGGNVEIIKKDGSKDKKLRTNLQGKINGLHESGKLTAQYADILHEHRFLGNEAVHELSLPSKEDLNLAIEIVENVFDTLYEIPSKGMKLKSKRLKK
ncbi:DUF4145 domain-containing protein [Winogradskyella endarachnes]|uniref:DUF4145 domain-containing protein n=1 Tax=Winogradskyella endarachnes TaxID=2681965 RepID=A0A6L6UBY5_9FLAO|nr:DUF4145 domain-containing protein [Winogradskyella endarachnes]MUU78462.1 DUF4145 domain-containing protein [Winogradskyella endarachnes]